MSGEVSNLICFDHQIFWAPFICGTVLDAEDYKQAGPSACFRQSNMGWRQTINCKTI